MNTLQSNVGKGTYTNPLPQMDAIASDSPFLPDERQELETAFHKAQTKLLDTVDAYFSERHGMTPTEAINELLFLWLTTPSTVLASKSTQNLLQLILNLTTLLSELLLQLSDLNFLKDQVENCKEEVSRD